MEGSMFLCAFQCYSVVEILISLGKFLVVDKFKH